MLKIKEHLQFLYGQESADALVLRVQAIENKYAPQIQSARASHPPAPIDRHSALLITYGDQVTAPQEAPLATLDAFLQAHASDLLSAVHLLPFFPYTSDDGFSVLDYYAIDPQLGTWDDVTRMGQHFDLMFDAVINHMSAQSEWFQKFLQGDPAVRDYFIVIEGNPDLSQVVRPRALPLLTTFQTPTGEKRVWTTFSADQVDLNYQNPALLLQILDVLLFYVAHGARLIRLDAIAFLWKRIGTSSLHLPETHAVIQFFRAVMDEIAPHVILVTETNVPHADNISYFGNGENEARWVYNFALPPLTLHTLQTGDAATLSRWAQTLVTPSPDTAFFNFLASHDGVGLNPARGILEQAEIDALVAQTLARGGMVGYKNNPDGTKSPYELNINYLDALTVAGEAEELSLSRLVCAHAIMFSLAGVPGIYFHSLFGSRGDRAAAEASGIPRRINRQKFTRAELEQELLDPSSRRALVFARLGELLRKRSEHAAFHPNAAQTILELDKRVFAILRTPLDASSPVLCLHNVSADRVRVRLPQPQAGTHRRDILGDASPPTLAGDTGSMELGPYQVRWLTPVG